MSFVDVVANPVKNTILNIRMTPREQQFNWSLSAGAKNLFLYSEEYSPSPWIVTSGVTVTPAIAETPSPHNQLVASKLHESVSGLTHNLWQTVWIGDGLFDVNAKFSYYAKKVPTAASSSPLGSVLGFILGASASSRDYFLMDVSFSTGNFRQRIWFDLTTGMTASQEIVTGTPCILETGMENVGNGWYRCWVEASGDTNTIACGVTFPPTDGVSNWTPDGDGVPGGYIWGAQAESRSGSDPSLLPGNYVKTEDTIVRAVLNTYEVDWERFVKPDHFSGGIYRELESVYEGSSGLTQQSLLASVESTPGTWYFDELNDVLYTHALTSGNPDDSLVVYTDFNTYFSTRGNVQDDIFYYPLISESSRVSVLDEAGDLFFGDVKSVGSGEIDLINGDGLFDSLSKDWTWSNARCRITFGAVGLTAGEFITVGEFEIEDMDPGRTIATVPLRTIQKQIQRTIPINVFSDIDYPDIDVNSIGVRKPLLFGSVSNITPILIDDTVEKGLYMVCDRDYQSLYSLPAVYSGGVEINAAYLDISLTGGTFAILTSYPGDTPSSVTCDATGPASFTGGGGSGLPVGSYAYETSYDYLKYYGELMGWIYCILLGVNPLSFNSTVAREIDAANKIPHAGYLKDSVSGHSLVRDIERGVLGSTLVDTNGLITPSIFIPSAGMDVGSLILIDEPVFTEFIPDRRLRQLFSRTLVQFGQDTTNGTERPAVFEDEYAKAFILKNRTVSRTISTRLSTYIDAISLAQRAVFLSKSSPTEVQISDASLALLGHSINDRILVSADRAPSSSGSWDRKVMDIKSIEKVFSPVPRINIVVSDLKGIGNIVGGWTSDTEPNWSSSTEEQRDFNHFWSDDNGFINPIDRTTKDRKVWW